MSRFRVLLLAMLVNLTAFLREAVYRPSSPAAGSRSEERAQAVGGRVQRLVVLLLIRFSRRQTKTPRQGDQAAPRRRPDTAKYRSRRDISAARVLPASCIAAGAATQRLA